MAYYVDTSALLKLVVAEPETAALQQWLTEANREPVACDLVRTELLRTIRRLAPARLLQARAVLDGVTLLHVTTAIFEQSGRLEPSALRSLDAIHIAAALELGDELFGLVTYDQRMAESADANGIAIVAPA